MARVRLEDASGCAGERSDGGAQGGESAARFYASRGLRRCLRRGSVALGGMPRVFANRGRFSHHLELAAQRTGSDAGDRAHRRVSNLHADTLARTHRFDRLAVIARCAGALLSSAAVDLERFCGRHRSALGGTGRVVRRDRRPNRGCRHDRSTRGYCRRVPRGRTAVPRGRSARCRRGSRGMTTPNRDVAEPRGLLIVYTGHGKGKTTAALGMVFRALGRGWRVTVVQFIKGKWKTGERVFAERLPQLRFLVMGLGFTWESDDISRDKAAARAAWAEARMEISSGERELVVLDELTYAFHYGFLALDEVLETLRSRPAGVHVVITGRDAPEALLEFADLVTEMKLVKHPFQRGEKAQLGVDF